MWRCQQRGNNIRDDDGKKGGFQPWVWQHTAETAFTKRGERREGSHSAADRFLIIGALV